MILPKNRTLAAFPMGIILFLGGCGDYYRLECRDKQQKLQLVAYVQTSSGSPTVNEKDRVVEGMVGGFYLKIPENTDVSWFVVPCLEYRKYNGIWLEDPKTSVEK